MHPWGSSKKPTTELVSMSFYSMDLYSTLSMCVCVCMYAVEYYAYYIDIFIVLDCHKYVCIMYVYTNNILHNRFSADRNTYNRTRTVIKIT